MELNQCAGMEGVQCSAGSQQTGQEGEGEWGSELLRGRRAQLLQAAEANPGVCAPWNGPAAGGKATEAAACHASDVELHPRST